MRHGAVILVTGKGGAGKTTVSAALGLEAARRGLRTLVVETANDGSLAHLLGRRRLDALPEPLVPGLDGVAVDQRRLVEEYFAALLRFRFLSRRLLASSTFSALTAAAPGITEFLLLERVLAWLDPPTRRAPRYDLVVLDGPATGHALSMLRAPDSLAAMVSGGPIGQSARRLRGLLGDRTRASVLLVSIPEEMSVRETIETHAILQEELGLRVARPVVNRVFPRRFSSAEAALVARLDPAHPAVSAARFAVARRREAERHIGTLRRALGATPVIVRELFRDDLHGPDLAPVGRTLGRAVLA